MRSGREPSRTSGALRLVPLVELDVDGGRDEHVEAVRRTSAPPGAPPQVLSQKVQSRRSRPDRVEIPGLLEADEVEIVAPEADSDAAAEQLSKIHTLGRERSELEVHDVRPQADEREVEVQAAERLEHAPAAPRLPEIAPRPSGRRLEAGHHRERRKQRRLPLGAGRASPVWTRFRTGRGRWGNRAHSFSSLLLQTTCTSQPRSRSPANLLAMNVSESFGKPEHDERDPARHWPTLLEESDELADVALGGEVPQHALSRGAAHPQPQLGVARQVPDRLGHGRRIPEGNDEAFDAVGHGLPRAADIGQDHRKAAAHRFDGGVREPLREARENEDVGAAQLVPHRNRRQTSQQADGVVQTEVVDREEDPLPVGAVADDREHDRHSRVHEAADGLQAVGQTLVPVEPAGRHDADAVGRFARVRGAEERRVHARLDDSGFLRVEAVAAGFGFDRLRDAVDERGFPECYRQTFANAAPGIVRRDVHLGTAAADDHGPVDLEERQVVDRRRIPRKVDDVAGHARVRQEPVEDAQPLRQRTSAPRRSARNDRRRAETSEWPGRAARPARRSARGSVPPRPAS